MNYRIPYCNKLLIAIGLAIGLSSDGGSAGDYAYRNFDNPRVDAHAMHSIQFVDLFGFQASKPTRGMIISEDLQCLALNIYFEARSEPAMGRRAVGHVVMNRVKHRDFPRSICEVVRQGGAASLNRCQFSWWCDGRPDVPISRIEWLGALKLAFDIYTGASKDPTGGALWYHADYSHPIWGQAFERGPKIGRHIFYRESREKAGIT